MRDDEFLQRQIEAAQDDQPEPVPASDDCELCGYWDSHLLDGICPQCRAKYKLKIALGSDPETEMAKAWGVWVQKSMYGRKYMGMERATFLVNAKGVIAAAWHKVKVPGHINDVLEAAKAL